VAHLAVGVVDVGGGGIDAELLGLLDLHMLVDQLVDCFLAGRLLVGGDEVELHALLDIEVGDGLAIDHYGDGLCLRRLDRARQDDGEGAGGNTTRHEKAEAL
jgi:hypothetical protein